MEQVKINERPKRYDDYVVSDAHKAIADILIKWKPGEFDNDTALEYAKEVNWIHFNDNGFEIAKQLEDLHPDLELVESLDSFGSWDFDEILNGYIKKWVLENNPSNKFNVGDKIKCNSIVNSAIRGGKEYFITGINKELANYYVHEEKDRNGGYVLPYEKIDECCILIN